MRGRSFPDKALLRLNGEHGMFAPMQIPQNPFLNGPGILRQPQPGSGQQIDAELQVKARAQGGSEAARPAKTASQGAPGAGQGGLATAGTLDEAVRSLAADGRLPRRGSLIDLKA
jgi:hypothetical protein